MFNLRNIVNKIADRGRESQPNSPARMQGDAAEGFLCPRCMKAFASQEDLQGHYESSHDGDEDESEGFICPKCMRPCSSPDDLHSHFLRVHDAGMDLSLSWEETDQVTQQVGSATAPDQIDVQAIRDPAELRRLLIEALEYKNTLQHEKQRLAERASQLAQDNVSLKAASDEGVGVHVALKERLKVVEAQLAHRESIDDAAVLRQELVQVQRVMDELTREKERERDELKAELQQLKDLQAAKEKHDDDSEVYKKLDLYKIEIQQKDTTIKDLQDSLESLEKVVLKDQGRLTQTMSEFEALKQKSAGINDNLQQQEKLNEVLQNQVSEFESVERKMKDITGLYENSRKVCEEKDEELKSCQAKLDALSKQKEILMSELQHKIKLCEELERCNSEQLKDLMQKSKRISHLESERAELLSQIEAGEGANTAIQQLSQEKAQLVNQLKEENENHFRIVQNLDEANSKLHDLEITNERLTLQLTTIRDEFRHVEHNLRLATNSLEKKSLEADDLRESYSEINVSLETALANNSQMLTEAAENVKVLNEMLENCNTKLDDLGDQNSKMKEEIREKDVEINSLSANLSDVENRLAESRLEVNKLQAELSVEKLSNSKLQEEGSRTASEVARLSDVVTQKDTIIASLESQILEVEKDLTECNGEKKRIEEEGNKELAAYRVLLNESKLSITEHEKMEGALSKQIEKLSENIRELEQTLIKAKKDIKEKEEQVDAEVASKEAVKIELALERNKCIELENDKLSSDSELKKVHLSLDEVAGEKLALEALLAASQSEQQALLERCYASSTESETQRKNNADLRRKLEESQAALHELGRENQTIQLELEKLIGRKWTEDSDAITCTLCQKEFSILIRKHHCRNCGQIFCNECSSKLAPLQTNKKPVRVCDSCYGELGSK